MNKYVKKFENLGEMDKFLEPYNLPQLNQEETESLDRTITASEIETLIKKLQAHKSPEPDGYTAEAYTTFREELTSILLTLFQKIQEGRLPTLFMRLLLS